MSTTHKELRAAVDALVDTEDAMTLARQKHHDAQVRLGAALRAARESKGLSLRACAARLKLSAPYLSDVERGNRGLSDGNLELLMGIIGPPSLNEIRERIVIATNQPIKCDGTRIGSNTERREPRTSHD